MAACEMTTLAPQNILRVPGAALPIGRIVRDGFASVDDGRNVG
jgi:hypothetical protein